MGQHNHGHGFGHDHGHGHGSHRSMRPLALALAITATFLVVEAIGAAVTGSLSLLADAGHMLTDVVGLVVALAAALVGRRAVVGGHRTFGMYRLEILAALLNGMMMLGLAGYVVLATVRRLGDPVHPDGVNVLLVAVLGLVANAASLWILQSEADQSLNVKAAHLEVLADLISTVGVMIGAVVIVATGWYWVDSVIAFGIAAFVFPRSIRLAAKACRMLLQHAPAELDLAGLEDVLSRIDGVREAHDLHVWTLTSGMDVLSVHLLLEPGDHAAEAVGRTARAVLKHEWGIAHVTVQVEESADPGCLELAW